MIIVDDMRHALPLMPEASFDAAVTDPPYEIGFMGAAWDRSGVSFDPATWRAVLRVLKPGAHLVAFGGEKGWHRLACAIEDGGFEIVHTLAWLYGEGMPKNTSTELKPAIELGVLARRRREGTIAENVSAYGTGMLNIDDCRLGVRGVDRNTFTERARAPGGFEVKGPVPPHAGGRYPTNVFLDEGVAHNIDERVGVRTSGSGAFKRNSGMGWKGNAFGKDNRPPGAEMTTYGDSGGVSRYFYVAKPDRGERDAGLPDGVTNTHPTTKPMDLMRYLLRLVAPAGARVLDPFCGSGSTLAAGAVEGLEVVGVDLETAHACIAWHRTNFWRARSVPRQVEVRVALRTKAPDAPQLFTNALQLGAEDTAT